MPRHQHNQPAPRPARVESRHFDDIAEAWTIWEPSQLHRVAALHSGQVPNGKAIMASIEAGELVSSAVDGVRREFRRPLQ